MAGPLPGGRGGPPPRPPSLMPRPRLALLALAALCAAGASGADSETCDAAEGCGPLECVKWRQTGGCDPNGPREKHADRACSEVVPAGVSGFCQCGKGDRKRRVRQSTCEHRPFTCEAECLQAERYECVAWRQTGGCSADGDREPHNDKGCDVTVEARASGYCECGDGRVVRKPGCDHGGFAEPFRCEDECGREADLYEELGLDSSASEKAIKQAFRKLSLKYHPDKTRDDPKLTARFAAIRDAYDVLGDDERRAVYDSSGFRMLEDAKNGKVEKAGAMWFDITVTLDKLYNGEEFTTDIQRKIICRGCRDVDTPRCRACNAGCAKEIELRNVKMGPMVMQQQVEVPSKERCRMETKKLNVEVQQGMAPGDTVTFKAMGEHQPRKIPGDVVLKIKDVKHDVFRREGNDLHVDVDISLKEALLGFERSITHMDGRRIVFGTQSVTRPGGIMRIEGEGMPHRGDPTQHGHLYLRYRVVMPEASALDRHREWLRANFPE